MPIHQVLRLGRGAIIELDASEDDEVSILANNFPVAKGTVVVQRQPHRGRGQGTAAAPGRHALSGSAPDFRGLPVRGLVPAGRFVTCAPSTPDSSVGVHSNAAVAELVDALA